MKEVARLAHVDVSVVSRLLSGDARLSVSDATRERVMGVVAELGYHRNAVARGLRMATTMSVGYLLPDMVSPSNRPLIWGAQQAAAAHDYVVVIGSADGNEGIEVGFSRLFGEGRVDGLLINCGVMSDEEVLTLASGPEPVVLVNRSVEGAACSVILDDFMAARIATQHLVDLGHVTLGHVAGPVVADTSHRRKNGFAEVAATAGATTCVIHAKGWDLEAGYTAAMELLSQYPVPSAVFAANVSMGMGVIRAARDLGLLVPECLSVISIHDAPLAQMTVPTLTAVATPLKEMGAIAVERLIARIRGEEVPRLTIVTDPAPYLVERESTAPCATPASSHPARGAVL